MTTANLHETLINNQLRMNFLTLQLSELQSQKLLATYSQADVHQLKSQDEEAVRDMYKAMYTNDPELKELYKDFTEIPDFEEEMDKIAAKYQDELMQLAAWETALDAEIKTDSAELEELKAYQESWKSMLQSSISEEFNYASLGS